MLTATSGFKTAIKGNAPYSIGKVDLINSSGTINFTSDDIIKFDITGSAIKNDKVLGNIAQHSFTMELHGDQTADIDLSLENRLQPFVGVLVGASYEYIQQQDFIVTECSYSDTSDITKIVATDYLVKLNKEFVDTISYPVTLLVYAQTVATYCGLTLENSSFFNSAFSVTSQPFPDLTSCKEIFSRIAEMALCFVVINKTNNKIELRTAFELPVTADETLTKDHYYDLKLNDHNFGTLGVNTLVLKISQVEGENTTVENATNVAIDGAVEIVIEDNPFINTQALRESVDTEMFAEIDEYIYQPYLLNYRGHAYLELGDILEITKMDNSTFKVPVFEMSLSYNGGVKGTLCAKTLNKSQTSYKYISTNKQAIRNAEIMVDKANAEILLRVTQTDLDTQLEDYSTITQTSESIALAVGTNTNNFIPYAQANFEQGTINDSGVNQASTAALRMKNYVYIELGKTYTLSISSGLHPTLCRIYFYTSANAFISYSAFSLTPTSVTAPFNAKYFRVRIYNAALSTFALSDLDNHSAGVTIDGLFSSGSRYVFDKNYASFYSDGLKLYDNSATPVLKVYFDTVNSRYVFNGEISATVGVVGGFTIGATKLTAGATNATAVGVASGETYAFWTGHLTASSAPFRVTRAGALTATSGAIGGWTINGTSGITKGGITLDAANERIYISSSTYLTAVGSSCAISGSLIPIADQTQYIGNPSYRFLYGRFMELYATTGVYPTSNGGGSLGSTLTRWGDVWCTDGAFNGSDIRLKKEVKEIEKGIDLILKLKPVQYKWKGKNRNHYGLIANQVKEVFDELGIDSGIYADPKMAKDYDEKSDPEGLLALRYTELISPMIQTIQDLHMRLSKLEKK